MHNFIQSLNQLTQSEDRHIKGASYQLLDRLQQITEELNEIQ
jgi:hypothetical protein